MSPQLSEELARAIDKQGGTPLRITHPTTGKAFFVVREEYFDRLKPLFEPDVVTTSEKQFQLEEAGRRAGWDEPKMDAYDRYDEYRSKASP